MRKEQLELLLDNLCGLIIQAQTLDIGVETTVQINDEWRVLIDQHSYELQKFAPSKEITVGVKKGQMSEEKWTFVGYHPDIGQCLRSCIQKEAAGGLYQSVQLSLDRYEELSNKFSWLVKTGSL